MGNPYSLMVILRSLGNAVVLVVRNPAANINEQREFLEASGEDRTKLIQAVEALAVSRGEAWHQVLWPHCQLAKFLSMQECFDEERDWWECLSDVDVAEIAHAWVEQFEFGEVEVCV